MAKSEWRDVTGTYGGGRYFKREEIEPRSWDIAVDDFRLVVTRHIDYDPEDWVITCPLFRRVLRGYSADKAKAKALSILRLKLNRLLEAL